VDASVSRIDSGSQSTTALDSGNNAASRIGFKGVEDLGNGLKASFVLENGFNVNNGTSATSGSAFSRLAYAGLGGAFGTVRLGRQNSQIKEAITQFDPFSSSGMVNGVDFLNGGGVPERVSNQITYISNDYAGFSGSVGYKFGNTAGDTEANRGYGLQLGYGNGPLNVQFAYQNENTTNATALPPVDADQKDAILGATYDFGAFKLHGAYGQRKTDAGLTLSGTDEKIRSYMLGATVPFGASKIRGEYIRNNNRDIDNADNSVWALSYSYSLSKRTTLYATYVRINNDDLSDLGVGGPGGVDTLGANGSGAAIGIQHNF
jgi:predicted porin